MTVLEQVKSGGRLEELEPGRIKQIADAIGVAPKLATLAMLDRSPDRPVGMTELSQKIEDAQGRDIGWRFLPGRTSTPLEYCSNVLESLELVMMTNIETHNRGEIAGAQITPLGSEVWPAIAGAYLDWERKYPVMNLNSVIGRSQQALQKGSSTKLEVIDRLLRIDGERALIRDIQVGTGRSIPTILKAVDLLENQGFVEQMQNSKTDPRQRMYQLTDNSEPDAYRFRIMNPITRAAAMSVFELREELGLSVISCDDILNRMQQNDPSIPVDKAWEKLRRWINDGSGGDYLDELTRTKDPDKAIRIKPEYEVPLKDFISRREALSVDEDYRAQMAESGRALIGSKKFLANAMRRARKYSHPNRTVDAISFEFKLMDAIPTDGIDIGDLYQKLKEQGGYHANEQYFRDKAYALNDLLEFKTNQNVNRRVGNFVRVYLREQTFGETWEKDARCAKSDVDPDLFTDDTELSRDVRQKRRNEAKSFCGQCAVRLACLAGAVQNNDTEHIRGGYTPSERGKLKKQQKDSILKLVTIGS